jgi:hypothetical protein
MVARRGIRQMSEQGVFLRRLPVRRGDGAPVPIADMGRVMFLQDVFGQ